MLVAGRAVHDTFAAILIPTALSLLAVTFTEPNQRARAFAVYGAIGVSGGARELAAHRGPVHVPSVTGDTTTPICTARPGCDTRRTELANHRPPPDRAEGRRTNANRDQADPP